MSKESKFKKIWVWTITADTIDAYIEKNHLGGATKSEVIHKIIESGIHFENRSIEFT